MTLVININLHFFANAPSFQDNILQRLAGASYLIIGSECSLTCSQKLVDIQRDVTPKRLLSQNVCPHRLRTLPISWGTPSVTLPRL